VNIACRFDKVIFEDGGTFDDSRLGPGYSKPLLAAHEKITGPCHNQVALLGETINKGIMTVEVSHEILRIGPKMSTSKSFTAHTSDGKTVWLPR
jgi:hypothetical protein